MAKEACSDGNKRPANTRARGKTGSSSSRMARAEDVGSEVWGGMLQGGGTLCFLYKFSD